MDCIGTATVNDHWSGGTVDLYLYHSQNPLETFKACNDADSLWGNLIGLWIQNIFEECQAINAEEKQCEHFSNRLKETGLQDAHWKWANKAVQLCGDCYEWFFLMNSDNAPEAICLVYHPKESRLAPGDIFYIDFIAVAPWNRSNSYNQRRYAPLAYSVLKLISKFAEAKLGYKRGFSLHSLPQAEQAYSKWGMLNLGLDGDKQMSYFEMPENVYKELIGA